MDRHYIWFEARREFVTVRLDVTLPTRGPCDAPE